MILHHAKMSYHEEIKKYCDMDNPSCLLRQCGKLMSPVLAKNLVEQVLLKLIPSKGCNSVDGVGVAPILHKFVDPLIQWKPVDAPEYAVLVELNLLVQPVSQRSSERQQQAVEYFENAVKESEFWLKSVCTSPNFKDMLELVKQALFSFHSSNSDRQLARLSKSIQKLVSLESSQNERYEHGKSMEVIEDIKVGLQRLGSAITEDGESEENVKGYTTILDSVLDFHLKIIGLLDIGMSEILDSLSERTDESILASHKATLDDLQLRVQGMTPTLVAGQFKSKLALIIKASDIVKAITPIYALCVELALVSRGKAGELFSNEEFSKVLRTAHLVMISRDRVSRKLKEFNSTSGLDGLNIPKSLTSIQVLLESFSGKEQGAKMFTGMFKELSAVLQGRLTTDSATDAKKAASYLGAGGNQVRQLSMWSSTPQRDSQAVTIAFALLTLIHGKTETVNCVGKTSIDGGVIKHIHVVAKAAHQISTMEKETYNASMERLLGEMWGKQSVVSMVNSLLETVWTAQAQLFAALKASMKGHAKKVQGVLCSLA